MCADDPGCSRQRGPDPPRRKRAGVGRGLARVPGLAAYEARCLETSPGWVGPGCATSHQAALTPGARLVVAPGAGHSLGRNPVADEAVKRFLLCR